MSQKSIFRLSGVRGLLFLFQTLQVLYQSIVEPYFDYCSIVWDDIIDCLTDKLQKLKNRMQFVGYYTPISIKVASEKNHA